MDQWFKFCKKEHPLQWKSSVIAKCSLCKKKNPSSRYACKICVEAYCIECYSPPIDGFLCGANHKMQFTESLINHTCDICDEPVENAFRCKTCDYDICESCRAFED